MIHHPITIEPMHITYSLKGSIPKAMLAKLEETYTNAKNDLQRKFSYQDRQPGGIRYKSYQASAREIDLQFYVTYDGLLDKRNQGPNFLSSPEAQDIIKDSWHHIAKQYGLVIYTICVMSNHVHIILRTIEEDAKIPSEDIILAHKKFTATKINQLQGQKGRSVWGKDFFDRDIRQGTFTAVLWYVLKNPVKAGITKSPFDYSGTWFDERLEEEYIGPYRHQWV